jgi:hypothetical protein
MLASDILNLDKYDNIRFLNEVLFVQLTIEPRVTVSAACLEISAKSAHRVAHDGRTPSASSMSSPSGGENMATSSHQSISARPYSQSKSHPSLALVTQPVAVLAQKAVSKLV